MFWHQNQGSNIWGSRDIKRFMPRHKMTIFFLVFWNQGVIKRGEMQKKFFRFLNVKVKL